jgi:hypothetical protein
VNFPAVGGIARSVKAREPAPTLPARSALRDRERAADTMGTAPGTGGLAGPSSAAMDRSRRADVGRDRAGTTGCRQALPVQVCDYLWEVVGTAGVRGGVTVRGAGFSRPLGGEPRGIPRWMRSGGGLGGRTPEVPRVRVGQ